MANKILARVGFTIGIRSQRLFGLLELADHEQQRFYLDSFSYFPETPNWRDLLLQKCCSVLHDGGCLDLGVPYDISIAVYEGGSGNGVVGIKGFVPTIDRLSRPIPSRAISESALHIEDVVFLPNASTKEIFAAVVAAIFSFINRNLEIPDHLCGSYEKYGKETSAYGDGDYYAILEDHNIPEFNNDWAHEFLYGEGHYELIDDERLEQINEGDSLTETELLSLQEYWKESITENASEADEVSWYSLLEHLDEKTGRVFCSIWSPSGYSFDNFQIEFIGFFSSRFEAEQYLDSLGELLDSAVN